MSLSAAICPPYYTCKITMSIETIDVGTPSAKFISSSSHDFCNWKKSLLVVRLLNDLEHLDSDLLAIY